jgi:hypothetical protein
MPTYKVAHIHVAGTPIIVVPVSAAFLQQNQVDQDALMLELKNRAARAGIPGNVVPIWDMGGGKMGFRAPADQHPFFQKVSFETLKKGVNKDLYW